MMRKLGGWLLILVMVGGDRPAIANDAAPLALVQRAYDRTLRAPGVRSIELTIHRAGRLVSRRAFDVAYRRDPEGAQSLMRFTAPSYLRGDALLVLETPSGVSDVWLYQAEERRPRRVGSTQNADAFYGSDLSFEELEHQRFEEWQLRRLPDDGVCDCAAIEAIPTRDSQYGRLLFWIDRAHQAVARIDFFRGTEHEPMKRLLVSLDDAVEDEGFLRIPRMRIEQVGRDAWTEVETVRMEIDPAISPKLFSAANLERETDDLYELAVRHVALDAAP
jgi:Outer membrane lipoprotein-sorting protein